MLVYARSAARPGVHTMSMPRFRRDKTIALSFDDGPGPDTAELVASLMSHGAGATFFVIGRSVAARADLLRTMAVDGFEIGNHTQTHPRLSLLQSHEVERELRAAGEAIEAATGVAPRLVRPPFGDDAVRLSAIAAGLGLLPVLWTLSTHDYDGRSAAAIAETILTDVRPGSVVLMHDAGPAGERRRETVEAVAAILPQLDRRMVVRRADKDEADHPK